MTVHVSSPAAHSLASESTSERAGGGLNLAGIGVIGIDHVGIAVTDLDHAVQLHETVLGLRCDLVEENESEQVREAMMSTDGPHGGPRIQLLASSSPTSTIGRFLDRSGPGLQHLALRVADIDKACRVLQERGVTLLYREQHDGTAGSRVNFVHPQDAGGVLIELVEPAIGPCTGESSGLPALSPIS
jgi:methylmalonyl-CoA/ethylmalonyl-CoA epimerase